MADVFETRIETNVPEMLAADRDALIASARYIVGGRVKYLKNWIRRLIRAAGFSQRLANTVRGESHGTYLGATGTVYSRAGIIRRSGAYDLITLFQNAQEITVAGQHFMAIPLPPAGRGPRGRPPTPEEFGMDLLEARVHDGVGVLVLRADPEGQPIFVLTHQVHRPKRLDLSSVRRAAGKDLQSRIIQDWQKRRVRIALRRVA